MRNFLVFTALFVTVTAAQAQTTTTNCTGSGNTVHCTSNTQPDVNWQGWSQQQQQIQQQNQENMNRAFSNLSGALAARREGKRQEKAVQEASAAEAAREAQIKAALASDTATQAPLPKEKPVLLACATGGGTVGIALYEQNHRADVTVDGVTKTRSATFTGEAVAFETSISRVSISRLDLSFSVVGTIPALIGQTVTGTCSLAERKF